MLGIVVAKEQPEMEEKKQVWADCKWGSAEIKFR